jgi:hypothetical protein
LRIHGLKKGSNLENRLSLFDFTYHVLDDSQMGVSFLESSVIGCAFLAVDGLTEVESTQKGHSQRVDIRL